MRRFFAWLERNGHGRVRRRGRRLPPGDQRQAAPPRREIVAADEREAGRTRPAQSRPHLRPCPGGRSRLRRPAAARRSRRHRHGAWPSRCRRGSGYATGQPPERVRRATCAAVGLPTALDDLSPPPIWSAAALIAHMGHDKKVDGGRPRFILARDIGAAFVSREVSGRRCSSSSLRRFGAT